MSLFLYVPQKAQAVCGLTGRLHLGQVVKLTGFNEIAERRFLFLDLVCLCFGKVCDLFDNH